MNPRLNRREETGPKEKSLLGQLTKGLQAKKVDGGVVYNPKSRSKALINKRLKTDKSI